MGQVSITETGLIGATSLRQLETNLNAIAIDLPVDAVATLDEVSRLEPVHPYMFFEEVSQDRDHGGAKVRKAN